MHVGCHDFMLPATTYRASMPCRGGVWSRFDLVFDLVFFHLALSTVCLFPCLLVLILYYTILALASCFMWNLDNEQQHVHRHDAHQNLSRFWRPPISFWSSFAGETNDSSNPAIRHIIFSSKQIKCIKQGLPIFLWGLQYWVFPGPKTWVFDRCPQITGRDYNNLVLVKNLSFDTTSEPITGIIVTLIHISMRFLKNIKTKNFYAKTWRKGSCPRRPLGIQWTAFARVFFRVRESKIVFCDGVSNPFNPWNLISIVLPCSSTNLSKPEQAERLSRQNRQIKIMQPFRTLKPLSVKELTATLLDTSSGSPGKSILLQTLLSLCQDADLGSSSSFLRKIYGICRDTELHVFEH